MMVYVVELECTSIFHFWPVDVDDKSSFDKQRYYLKLDRLEISPPKFSGSQTLRFFFQLFIQSYVWLDKVSNERLSGFGGEGEARIVVKTINFDQIVSIKNRTDISDI